MLQWYAIYCRVDCEGMICEQKGIFRINCVDCLDRTNVVQTAIARVVMETQVRRSSILLFLRFFLKRRLFVNRKNINKKGIEKFRKLVSWKILKGKLWKNLPLKNRSSSPCEHNSLSLFTSRNFKVPSREEWYHDTKIEYLKSWCMM